tara:strand:+ start:74 stop:283 length:210 start_codon:yes stop_codon:yes gene_type:complete
LELFRLSPELLFCIGNKFNLYKDLKAVLKKTNAERRNNAVFKHGTFPVINIVELAEASLEDVFFELYIG